MSGYGVASRAMFDYNADNNTDDLYFDGRSIVRHIIYPTYYLMYGATDKETGQLDGRPSMVLVNRCQLFSS